MDKRETTVKLLTDQKCDVNDICYEEYDKLLTSSKKEDKERIKYLHKDAQNILYILFGKNYKFESAEDLIRTYYKFLERIHECLPENVTKWYLVAYLTSRINGWFDELPMGTKIDGIDDEKWNKEKYKYFEGWK